MRSEPTRGSEEGSRFDRDKLVGNQKLGKKRESGITSLLGEVIGLEKSLQKRSEVADSKGMSIDH